MDTQNKEGLTLDVAAILERAKPLRRMLQPTEHEADALRSLQGADKDQTLTKQARARLAALTIVRQSFTDFASTSGYLAERAGFRRRVARARGQPVHVPPEMQERFGVVLHTQKGLEELQRWMEANVKAAEDLEADMSRRGIKVDPTRPARSTVRKAGRGSPPTLVTETVKALLHEKYPEWREGEAFPHKNSDTLRAWLHKRLAKVVGSRQAGIDSGAMLFDPQDIDPRPRGPLYNIINHLRNPGR